MYAVSFLKMAVEHSLYPNSSETFVEAVKIFATSQCLIGQCFKASDIIPDGSVFDFVIIGGGTAGCVLANRLSKMSNAEVLLVEAGGDPPLDSMVPALLAGLKNSKYDWNYTSQNEQFSSQYLINSTVDIRVSKMLGGGSSHNFMNFLRGNRRDYDLWAKEGNEDWDFDSLLKYFKKAEKVTDPVILANPSSRLFRGTNGPVKQENRKKAEKYYDPMFVKALIEYGLSFNPDLNGENQMGTGIADNNIYRGIRQSTAIAYLIPAQKRKNLHILKETLATKILINKQTKIAYGVKLRAKYGHINVYVKNCSGEVVLSAGAIKTPQLLMLSGIGPKNHLIQNKIKVLADLPVGNNLQDHTATPLYLSRSVFDISATNDPVSEYMTYFFDRTGQLASLPISSLTTFLSLSNQSYPDFQIYNNFYPINTDMNGYCQIFGYNETLCSQINEIISRRDLIVFLINVMNVKSKGVVRLRDADPESQPLIWTGFAQSEEDLEKIASFYETFTKIVDTATMRKYSAQLEHLEISSCKTHEPFTRDYWKCLYLNVVTTANHWVGTAKMGPAANKDTVVDDKLRVLKIRNLRVVDASIMPNIVSANTNNAVIVIAEKAADLIKAKFHNRKCNTIY